MYRTQTTIFTALVFLCLIGLTAVARGEQPTTQASAASPPANDLSNLSLEDLMNVEVTSVSKKQQPMADAPAAISVISQDDIARSGFSTIPDLLRLAPGMDVARINSSSWAVSARGLNDEFANNLLVLQDGRSLYNPLFGGVFWNTVDYVLPDLDRIEVIRGPGATLWGANAVNGVINITTKDAQDTQGWLLDSRGSNQDSNLSVRYGGKLADDTYYRVYTKASYDEALDTSSGGDAGDDWYAMRGGFRIDKHASDQDSFTLQGDVNEDRAQLPTEVPIFTPPFLQTKTFGESATTGNVLGRWTHRVDDDSDFALQLYYDYFGQHGPDAEYDQHTIDLDFHDRFVLGERNEIMWGFGYRAVNSTFLQNDQIAFDPPTRTDSLYNAFVQDTITLEPRQWFLTMGSKFEHNDYTGFEIEPSVRLLWTPNEHNSVWAAVSRAVRTPTIVESDVDFVASRFQIPTGTGATVPGEALLHGNPDIQSEKLTAYELGYRMQPTKQFSVDLATFYNNYGDISEAIPSGAAQPGVPVIIPLTEENAISGDTYGGEIASTLQVTDAWRLTGSYSLLESTFFSTVGPAAMADAKEEQGSAPQQQAQVHSYWDITRNLQLNAGIYYTGRVTEFDIPAYVTTDLNLVWQPKEGMELKVGVLGAFDNHHPEYGVSDGQGLPSEPPRTVYAELSYKF